MSNPLFQTLPVYYSVIIPFYNEAENLSTLLSELRQVMDSLGAPYEILLVDDESKDQTQALLLEKASSWPECRVFQFEQNSGQSSALYFGMKKALGEIFIILDGDGQNDPADIPTLIALQKNQQADMAIGVRANRKDSLLRRTMSRFANAIRSRFLGDGVQDTGCAIKVLKREVSESFIPLKTLYSFMPALAVAAGFCVVQHAVNHRPRLKGKSNYGLMVMSWRPLVDMVGMWWFINRRCRTRHGVVPAVAAPTKLTSKSSAWKKFLVVCVLILPFFVFLGTRGLNEPDEGRYAEIGREMLVSGEWMTPKLNGLPHFQKPPIIYWATAASLKIFGFNEVGARLPSTFAAFGILAMTAWIASMMFGRSLVLPSIVILSSSILFFALARFLTPDMLMSFFIVSSIAFLVKAMKSREGTWLWFMGFFIAMGLGFLTKGPMAWIVPASVALALQVGSDKNGSRFSIPWIKGLILTLIISISWFVIMIRSYPQLLDYFVGYEFIQRFGSNVHGRSKPFWYFIPVFVGGFLPWVFFVPSMMKRFWERARLPLPLNVNHWLLMGWIIPPFIILSLSGSKLLTYLLPLFPAFALGLAIYWKRQGYRLRTLYVVGASSILFLLLAASQAEQWNDYFGRQASIRSLAEHIQSQTGKSKPTVFASGIRAHGLEFYLGGKVAMTSPEADLVLETEPEQQTRLYDSPEKLQKSMAHKPNTFGVILYQDFVQYFPDSEWKILKRAGAFVLIAPLIKSAVN